MISVQRFYHLCEVLAMIVLHREITDSTGPHRSDLGHAAVPGTGAGLHPALAEQAGITDVASEKCWSVERGVEHIGADPDAGCGIGSRQKRDCLAIASC